MKFQPNFVFAWKRSSKPNVSLQVLHQNSWKSCLTVLLLTLLLPNTNSCSWYDTFLVFFRDAPRHLGQTGALWRVNHLVDTFDRTSSGLTFLHSSSRLFLRSQVYSVLLVVPLGCFVYPVQLRQCALEFSPVWVRKSAGQTSCYKYRISILWFSCGLFGTRKSQQHFGQEL